MQDPMDITLRRAYFEIPNEILNTTFSPVTKNKTLDACIIEDVIQGIVLHDCNNGGGKLLKLPLTAENSVCLNAPPIANISLHNTWAVYQILPHARENKPLSAVHAIHYPYNIGTGTTHSTPYGWQNAGRNMGLLASTALNAQTHAESLVTPTPILLSGDCIRLDPPQAMHIDWVLECRVEYDKNFTNMDVNVIPTFTELSLAAIKAYIYNKMIFAVERTYLVSGQELGIFKNIVEKYEDQFERYKELVVKFNSISVLEPERLKKLITYML